MRNGQLFIPRDTELISEIVNCKNEAADKLAALGAQIQDGHRIVERKNSHEPPMQDTEYKDNG